MVELPGASPGQQRQVSRELIAHIIEQRLDEILGLVWREVERSGESDQLGAGVVLTGGGAQLTGTLDVAQHAFGTTVRIGTPGDNLYGLVDSIRRPKFATATGLAIYGGNLTGRAAQTAGAGVLGRMVGWMKEFF
jgi:cell division protein FtsA